MNNKTSATAPAIHLTDAPSLAGEDITITMLRIPTTDDTKLYIPPSTNYQTYSVYVQIQGSTQQLGSFSAYGTLVFQGVVQSTRMNIKQIEYIEFDLGSGSSGGLFIAKVKQAIGTNFYINITYA